jgi:hypothetical protein
MERVTKNALTWHLSEHLVSVSKSGRICGFPRWLTFEDGVIRGFADDGTQMVVEVSVNYRPAEPHEMITEAVSS